MASSLDLGAYFARIGWNGATDPTFQTLAGILHAHTGAIPFENLDVLLGRPPRLDLEGLQDKLVTRRRGGYCFEHATLMAAVLAELGFKPATHAARVVLARPKEQTPRNHMFLTVPLDGETYLVDPGFASYSAREPLPLRAGTLGTHQSHVLTQDGDLWTLHVRRDGAQIPGWVATLAPEQPIDFEVSNHWIATCPSSPFTQLLMMSAMTEAGRVNVMNRDVTLPGGETRRLGERKELRDLLAAHFGFDLPEVETLNVPAIDGWR
ncbi:MAG TPA: arylamine N-acetyltransferase [Rhizomicrobium sp.]|jgi:N-hydroxyarylamine O-acetyltransferase|nr:arylamine N-acetyltransferase [Rhizomicrobium sp.]